MTNFLESNFSDYEVRRLRKDETIKSFDCGDADLNDFIRNRAESYNKAFSCYQSLYQSKADSESSHDNRHHTHQLNQYIKRWACCIFERISYGISYHCCLMLF